MNDNSTEDVRFPVLPADLPPEMYADYINAMNRVADAEPQMARLTVELGAMISQLNEFASLPTATGTDPAPTANEPLPQYVTLDQMAASVHRSKRTLEKLLHREVNPLPAPDITGGGGKPNEWIWNDVRSWLEVEFSRRLPERFPG